MSGPYLFYQKTARTPRCVPVSTGPAPRKLSFGGSRQAAKKKRLVLDDSDDEGATMADADTGEDSGSVFEAQDADESSSEDEGNSAAGASDEVQRLTSS